MKYAYLDEAWILHVTEDEATAKKIGKYEAVDIPAQGGYPFKGSDGGQVIVYGLNECYKNGENRTGGEKFDTTKVFPDLAELYKKLLT